MAKEAKIRTPTVHIVLDTNAMFTELADKLLKLELSDFILSQTKQFGLDIRWHIPDVVTAERRHQMKTRAAGLLIPVSKLEALLGHNLNLTEDIVSIRVDEAIQRQIQSHSLTELHFEPSQVDWLDFMNSAVCRRPPFSPEGEKGFRDAIVLESFLQLSTLLPRTPTSCRVILLTADALLKQACDTRIEKSQWSNTYVIENLEDLKTTLNAIAAHVSDDLAKQLSSSARSMFFQSKNEDSLYFKWNIGAKLIPGKPSPPDLESSLTDKGVLILSTGFQKKEGQKIIFSTPISWRWEAKKTVLKKISNEVSQPESQLNTILSSPKVAKSASEPSGVTEAMRLLFPATVLEEVKTPGKQSYEILWSATLTRRGTLINPAFIAVNYNGMTWEPQLQTTNA